MVNITTKKAIFGAGCFWGIEQLFFEIKGVINTKVGYSGGKIKNPTYKEVCSGLTGHAEVVQLIFNEKIISYPELLDVFWNCHNPTTMNQQGLDIGSQYRSVIFYYDKNQKREAEKSKKKIETKGKYLSKIVTEILPKKDFYLAENYHQQYLKKKGLKNCHI